MEAVNRTPPQEQIGAVFFVHGGMGEIYRGGYYRGAAYGRTPTIAAVEDRLRRLTLPERDLLTPEVRGFLNAEVAELAGPWRSRTSPETILDEIFLTLRLHRWASSGFNGAIDKTLKPFADNRAARFAYRASTHSRAGDELVRPLVERFAPQIGEIPFANGFWGFEGRGEDHLQQQMREHAPFLGQHGMRYSLGVQRDLLREFDEVVFSSDAARAGLFEVVDRRRLEDIRKSRNLYDIGWVRRLWAAYTVALLITGEWLEESASRDASVEIRLDPLTEKYPWQRVFWYLIGRSATLQRKFATLQEKTGEPRRPGQWLTDYVDGLRREGERLRSLYSIPDEDWERQLRRRPLGIADQTLTVAALLSGSSDGTTPPLDLAPENPAEEGQAIAELHDAFVTALLPAPLTNT